MIGFYEYYLNDTKSVRSVRIPLTFDFIRLAQYERKYNRYTQTISTFLVHLVSWFNDVNYCERQIIVKSTRTKCFHMNGNCEFRDPNWIAYVRTRPCPMHKSTDILFKMKHKLNLTEFIWNIPLRRTHTHTRVQSHFLCHMNTRHYY